MCRISLAHTYCARKLNLYSPLGKVKVCEMLLLPLSQEFRMLRQRLPQASSVAGAAMILAELPTLDGDTQYMVVL